MAQKNFINQTAVITGAAHGIGLALARHCLALGCRVVLADIDQNALEEVGIELSALGDVKTWVTDVADGKSVQELAQFVKKTFGVPQLLFNNAGVSGYVGPIWKLQPEQIKRIMDINFMGVVHGIQAFIPEMLKVQRPAHIVNTASMAGFYTFPYFSTYIISKHSVIALSECLFHDLRRITDSLKVSVLCPGGVNTDILESSKQFRDLEQDDIIAADYDEKDVRFMTNFARMVRKGMTPKEVAELVFQGIEKEQFYILTDPELKKVVRQRSDHICAEKNPALLDLYTC